MVAGCVLRDVGKIIADDNIHVVNSVKLMVHFRNISLTVFVLCLARNYSNLYGRLAV